MFTIFVLCCYACSSEHINKLLEAFCCSICFEVCIRVNSLLCSHKFCELVFFIHAGLVFLYTTEYILSVSVFRNSCSKTLLLVGFLATVHLQMDKKMHKK